MKKSERLNQELIFLSNKKSFNLTDLIKEFKISKRTALRDIEDLEALGLSFYVESGRYGGYKLLKQNLLTPIYFDNVEITSIFFALKALSLLSSTPFEKSYSQIYQKLLVTLSKEQQQYVLKLLEAVNYYNISPINISENLPIILDSILNLKILNISYKQYNYIEKKIQVYDLFYRNGIWFCNAIDITTKSWEVYRCDYIKKCCIDNNINIFLSRDELKISLEQYNKIYKNIAFKCKLTSFGKELFLKKHYPNMFLTEENNNFFITGNFSDDELDYMVHYLIGFGKNIIIESPELLKRKYLEELNKIIELY